MRKPPEEQKLAELERDFEPLLVDCLRECVERRRWGLFGQNEHPEAAKYLHWEEASRRKDMALEIRRLRSAWGHSNATVEKFLQCCAESGQNVPSEAKRAAKLLSELTSAKGRALKIG